MELGFMFGLVSHILNVKALFFVLSFHSLSLSLIQLLAGSEKECHLQPSNTQMNNPLALR